MYALADKGLGPVAVHLPRYIRDGLKHLTDEKSYVIISESQAQEEATKLYSNIMDWTFEHRKSLNKNKGKKGSNLQGMAKSISNVLCQKWLLTN